MVEKRNIYTAIFLTVIMMVHLSAGFSAHCECMVSQNMDSHTSNCDCPDTQKTSSHCSDTCPCPVCCEINQTDLSDEKLFLLDYTASPGTRQLQSAARVQTDLNQVDLNISIEIDCQDPSPPQQSDLCINHCVYLI